MDRILEQFSETSLQWGLVAVLLIAFVYGVRAWAGFRQVAQDARTEYDYKMDAGMISKSVTRDQYMRAYRKSHAPRAPAYVAVTLSVIALLTLPALGVFYWVTFVLWEMNGKDKVFAPGLIVHSLLMFFLIIFFWALIAYLAARHYHGNTPLSVEKALKKEDG